MLKLIPWEFDHSVRLIVHLLLKFMPSIYDKHLLLLFRALFSNFRQQVMEFFSTFNCYHPWMIFIFLTINSSVKHTYFFQCLSMLDSLSYHKHYHPSEQTHFKDLEVWNFPLTTIFSFLILQCRCFHFFFLLRLLISFPTIFPGIFLHHGYSYFVSPFLLPGLDPPYIPCSIDLPSFLFCTTLNLCCLYLAS